MNKNIVFENSHIKIEIEKSSIPWFKIFSIKEYKEFSETSTEVKTQILTALDIIEKEMLKRYSPKKINIASFGNYLPHLHFHIMARFADDSHFPEPMWGKKQREGTCYTKDIDKFSKIISLLLEELDA